MSSKFFSLFSPAPFFMVRMPLLPVETMRNIENSPILEQSLLQFYEEHEEFQEAIALASPSLSKMIKEKKHYQQILPSLLKYLIRMTSRPTPFGVFAFVSAGKWNPSIKGTVNLSKVSKRSRLDMEWICKIVEKLCKDPANINQIPIQKNPLVIVSGGRATLKYQRKVSAENSNKDISIKMSPLLEILLKLTIYPITLPELEKELLKQIPSIDLSKTRKVIETLIKQQFLNFILASSLLTTSPLQDLLDTCPNLNVLQLKNLFADYNSSAIGKGQIADIEQSIQKLLAKTESTEKSSIQQGQSPIQVDAYSKENAIALPELVGKELSQATTALWHISRSFTKEHFLRSYHEKFAEKYGTTRIIPLLELLNEDCGFSIPEIYNDEKYPDITIEKHSKWGHWLKNKLFACLYESKNEIEITNTDLIHLFQDVDLQTAPPSFDAYFEINASSTRAIETGEFTIILNTLTSQGCNTFGRFFDLIDETKPEIENFLSKEEALFERAQFIESSYLPSQPRGANVAIHPSFRKNVIDLGKSDKVYLRLEDIYVGATSSKLFLTLKDGLNEIFVTSTNLLNPTYAPIPLRFIRDISRMQFSPLLPWTWGDLDNAHFLPRVRYQKVILSPAQWHFDVGTIKKAKTPDEIYKVFTEWADHWKMPKKIYMGTDDQRLYIDRFNPCFSTLIMQEIKKNPVVHFQEKLVQEWIKSERGTHSAEFVLPFIKNFPYASNPINLSYKAVNMNVRYKLLGSEWIYIRVYIGKENENDFLFNYLLPFIDPAIQQGIIKKWHFVRYQDPVNHLRIRFNGDIDALHTIFEPSLKKWVHHLLERRFVRDIAFGTYEREVERYGGIELINAAESMFYHDSIMTITLLKAIRDKKITLPDYVVGCLNIIDFIAEFDLNPVAQEPFSTEISFEQVKFQKLVSFFTPASGSGKEALTGARKWKDNLPIMMREILSPNPQEGIIADISLLRSIFSGRKLAQAHYLEMLKKAKSENSMTVPFGDILHSFIHMHANRFMGTDKDKESKIRLYAYYGLTNLVRHK